MNIHIDTRRREIAVREPIRIKSLIYELQQMYPKTWSKFQIVPAVNISEYETDHHKEYIKLGKEETDELNSIFESTNPTIIAGTIEN